MSTTTLYRPTGPEELRLVERSGWTAWPPRLPDQPIFYPVLDENYAIMIARDWNVPAHGIGHVTRFHVDTEFLARYPVRQVGGDTILELWVPAEELAEFNANLVGSIELIHTFRAPSYPATGPAEAMIDDSGPGAGRGTVPGPHVPIMGVRRGRRDLVIIGPGRWAVSWTVPRPRMVIKTTRRSCPLSLDPPVNVGC